MQQLIRTVIIDDEKNSILLLTKLLEKYCTNVKVVGTGFSVDEGVSCILEFEPELVFLDINMPDGNGFDVLTKVGGLRNFQVIFITAFDRYAMKAFEFSALHYILKPIDYKELQESVKRFENLRRDEDLDSKLRILHESLNNQHKKIILPSSDGLSIVELDDIVRLESFNNYTTFFLRSGKKVLVSKPINSYEEILSDLFFSRIHSKHLINLKWVKKYVKGRGGYVILEDDAHVDVSEGKKKDFLKKLSEFARG